MKLLALFFTLILLTAPALAGSGTVIIYGTNASNAQSNLTISDAPSRVNVTAWNVGGVKTFKVNVTNASDTLTFQISNVTAGQVNELKINGTAINGYQANSNGNITFTRVQTTGNSTFNLAPAVNQGGYNTTWGYFQNIVVQTPFLKAYNSTVLNLSNAVYTKVQLNTESYDTNNNFAGSNFTVTIPGYYKVNYNMVFTNLTAGSYLLTGAIYKNGVLASYFVTTSGSSQVSVGREDTYLLNIGDTIELYAKSSSGNNFVQVYQGIEYTNLMVEHVRGV